MTPQLIAITEGLGHKNSRGISMSHNSLTGFEFLELCFNHGCRSLNDVVNRFDGLFSISTVEKWHSRRNEPKALTKIALYAIAKEQGWI